jgi:hypothetical protein
MSPWLISSAMGFALIALLRLGVGLFVPFAIRAGPSTHPGPPGLFHPRPDAALFGSEPISDRDASRVRVLGIMLWDWLSGTLVSAGILELAVVWFGLARGERWALVALSVANLALAPYYTLIVGRYVRAGARLRILEIPPLIWVPAILAPLAILLGWIGLFA